MATAAEKQRIKRRVGRPTKYKPEYCEMLIDHMKEGLSFACFGALVHASLSMIQDWEKAYPEFRVAKGIGESYGRAFWEKMGRAGALGQIKGFVPQVYVFTMKNRFNWSDRTDLKIGMAAEDFQKEFGLLRDIPRAELLDIVVPQKLTKKKTA